MSFNICVMNNVAEKGLNEFSKDSYRFTKELLGADALLLRSADVQGMEIPPTLKVVGRAGAGTNNIPVDRLTKQGIPVLNTPGANANAVKELVLAGLFLASRHICEAWHYVHRLEGDDKALEDSIEGHKKQFVGTELPGKTLGIIGLGAIGVKVANAALALGMRVIGFDPAISVERAWELSSGVIKASSLENLLAQSDYVSCHVPLLPETQHFIQRARLSQMKKGAVLLNFARQGVVDEAALLTALNDQHLAYYVCDFPSQLLKNNAHVIALPHLGASTIEAEENCAVMVAQHLIDFLENGHIHYSVNFPSVLMPRLSRTHRLAIVNANVPNMLGQISTVLANNSFNIADMMNKSKGEIAYTLLDVDQVITDTITKTLREIEGIISVRVL